MAELIECSSCGGRHYRWSKSYQECARGKNTYSNYRNSPTVDSEIGEGDSARTISHIQISEWKQKYGDEKATEMLDRTIKEYVESTGKPLMISTVSGRVIPALGASHQEVKTSKKGNISHTLLKVDVEHEDDNGVIFAHQINSDMQQCYDYDAVGKQVTVVSIRDLKENYESYVISDDGLSGCGVKYSGEIGGLYSIQPNSGSIKTKPGVGQALLQDQLDNNGQYLECFDTFLPKIYEKCGMKTVAKLDFNREYAPVGWDYEKMKQYNNGEPSICFMAKESVVSPNHEVVVSDDWEVCDDYTRNNFVK